MLSKKDMRAALDDDIVIKLDVRDADEFVALWGRFPPTKTAFT